MNFKISLLLLALIGFSCQLSTDHDAGGSDEWNYLIEVDEMKQILDDQNVKIIDFRKREFYDQGHIEGALHIWRSHLEDTTYAYNGMMPTSNQLEQLFSDLGIGNDDTIVIYDDDGLCDAARLWWILDVFNFSKVKMLNGGLKEWKEQGGITSQESPIVERSSFKFSNDPSMKHHISMQEFASLKTENVVILDTRTVDEYSGKMQKNGAAKAGRIPNSIHQDWAYCIDFSKNKKFRSLNVLEAIYAQHNINKDDSIIVYCHSGVRSAHTTFVLTQLLGYQNVRNYDGSWTEWSHFSELKFEADSVIEETI
ncbi:MAG: sulfurtransferase [Cyclobacteriaceae bacterium]